jgi:hypothetical protein
MKHILLLGGVLSSAALVIAGLALAQSPSPTPRPYLAKNAEEAIKLLGTWQRIASGQDYFREAAYVGSAGCGGAGCHDLQVNEWHQTWHSKILRDVASLPSTEIVGDFNGAVVPFKDIRAVAKGGDADLGKLQQVPVKFDVRTERAGGKYFFVIVDPKDTNTPEGGQRYEVALVVGGKWQQTYHVRPAGQDGNPGDFFFPAPIRWSVNPDKSPGQPPGFWEVVNFQPENWVWYDNSELATPRKPSELPVARFAEQKCMGCHTTGFEFAPIGVPPATVHWSMKGNGELAVGCERCHGPGSKHVDAAKQKAAAGSKLDPERDQMSIAGGAATVEHFAIDHDLKQPKPNGQTLLRSPRSVKSAPIATVIVIGGMGQSDFDPGASTKRSPPSPTTMAGSMTCRTNR